MPRETGDITLMELRQVEQSILHLGCSPRIQTERHFIVSLSYPQEPRRSGTDGKQFCTVALREQELWIAHSPPDGSRTKSNENHKARGYSKSLLYVMLSGYGPADTKHRADEQANQA
jgi:hypothetical protein